MPPPYGFTDNTWDRAGLKYGRRVYSNQVDAQGGSWEDAAQWIINNHQSTIPSVIDNWSIQTDTAEMVNAGVAGMFIEVRTVKPAIVFQGPWYRDGTSDSGKRNYIGRLGDIDPGHFPTNESIETYAKTIIPDVIDNWAVDKSTAKGIWNIGIDEKWMKVETVLPAAASTTLEEWKETIIDGKKAWHSKINGIESDDKTVGSPVFEEFIVNEKVPDTIFGAPISKDDSFVKFDMGWRVFAVSTEITTIAYLDLPWKIIGKQRLSVRVLGIPFGIPWKPVARAFVNDLGETVVAEDGNTYTIDKGSEAVIDLGISGIYIELNTKKSATTETPGTEPPTPAPEPAPTPGPDPSDPPTEPQASNIPTTFFQMNLGLIIILLAFDKNDEDDLQYIKWSLGVLSAYGLYSIL